MPLLVNCSRSENAQDAKPALEIDFGDMQCEVELWDSEWRQGKARDFGIAVARLHGGGFVPDPPFDDAQP